MIMILFKVPQNQSKILGPTFNWPHWDFDATSWTNCVPGDTFLMKINISVLMKPVYEYECMLIDKESWKSKRKVQHWDIFVHWSDSGGHRDHLRLHRHGRHGGAAGVQDAAAEDDWAGAGGGGVRPRHHEAALLPPHEAEAASDQLSDLARAQRGVMNSADTTLLHICRF